MDRGCRVGGEDKAAPAVGPRTWPPVPEGLPLPAPAIPFPVSAPFRVRSDLSKLESGTGDGGLLCLDRDWPRYAQEKRQRLRDRAHPLVLVAEDAEPAILDAALREIVERLAEAHPSLVARTGEGGAVFASSGLMLVPERPAGRLAPRTARDEARPVSREIAGLPAPTRGLATLSLSCQEDFVLMAPRGGGLVAEAMSVSFASGWEPAEKLGRALAEIHAPVAEGEALRAASPNLARAMLEKGPFVRHVWTLAPDASLARWPGARAAARPGSVRDLWFRCERQVTLPLPRCGRALFLIRVYVAPLSEVASDAARRAVLVASLRSMSEEVVAYKGLGHARALVLQAWASST